MKRLEKLLLPLLTLAVVGSVAVAAGRTFWHVAGISTVQPPAIQSIPVAEDAQTDPIDLSATIALAPFGTDVAEAAVEVAPTATSLDLALRGVVLQADPSQSFALIAAGGTTRSYMPGDTIEGRATLVEVAERQVILDVDGTRQPLSFPEMALAVSSGDAQPDGVTPQSNLDRLRAALGVGAGSTEIADPPPPETTEDYINMWRTRIIRNPNQVLGEIGLVATENGYMVGEEHDPGVKLAGLQAGDRVARVNGQAVGNVDQDRKFFDEVAASGVARIEVVRDGRTFVMSFPLR